MFYCGIDIAKYKHEASVIDMSGKALSNSISFANDRQGCEKARKSIFRFKPLLLRRGGRRSRSERLILLTNSIKITSKVTGLNLSVS